jgi:hypothetical protein
VPGFRRPSSTLNRGAKYREGDDWVDPTSWIVWKLRPMHAARLEDPGGPVLLVTLAVRGRAASRGLDIFVNSGPAPSVPRWPELGQARGLHVALMIVEALGPEQ